ncbi:MAG TPA: DUF177 domain-containing protein [Ignavibacteria bacterium]|nr:DUF177 domain-containing protein [Ignavibacteria bacterium]
MSIKINIGSLNDGSQILDITSDAKELGLQEGFVKDPLNIKLDLFKTTHQLDIKACIQGIIFLECDRCLENFEKAFTASFELVFVQQSLREEAINEDYIRTYSPHMKSVDITTDIKEAVILTVPMKKLPDEKPDGSCSWCGRSKDFWKDILVEKNDDDDDE